MDLLKRGLTSGIFTVFIQDTSSTRGGGLTGLTNASTNLVIAMRRELSSSVTTYSGANIEAQTTIGTFQAPSSSSKIRFKAVDGTNMPGVYEIQVHDSATNGLGSGDASKFVDAMIYELTTTALNIATVVNKIMLEAVDRQSATAFVTGINSLAPPANWNTDVVQTGDAYARIGAAGASLTALGDTRIANLDATITSRTKPADTQARVTLVDTVTTYTGNTVQTGDAFSRLGVAGAGLTALGDTRIANLDATITSRTKPADTQARVALVDVLTTYTGDTPQTGDSYAGITAVGASISADVAAVKSDTGGIKTKTDSLTFTVTNQVDSNVLDWKSATAPVMTGDAFARLGSPTGASIAADVAALQADTDNLQTRIPAALVSGRMDASVGAMAADTLTASALAADAVAEIQAGLSTVTAAGIRTAIGLASANLDTQLDALDSLDATVSSRSTYAGGDTSGTTILLGRIPGTIQPQTGDSFARLGAAGAGLTALGDARIAYLDVAVSSRNAITPPTAMAIRAEMDTSSTKLANLDATVSSRNATTPPTVAAIRTEIDTNSDKLDVAVSTRAASGDIPSVGDIQDGLATAAQLAALSIPTSEQIALAVILRKITFDSDANQFVVWNDAGDTEVGRLTPTRDAAALPIIGMEPV